MAMTKKRISGILLAVALFVGVFAATPAFATTTSPVTGVTIDWAEEGISWTDKNIVVSTDKTFVDGTKEIAMPDADVYSDLKPETTIYIKKYYETADKAVSVEIPARPATPTKFSLLDDDITAGETSIKINSPIAGQEYGIKLDGEPDTAYAWNTTGVFTGLVPDTDYVVTARIPSTAGKFASNNLAPARDITTLKTSTFFFNRNTMELTLAEGYTAWESKDVALTGVETADAKQISGGTISTKYIGSTIYVIEDASRDLNKQNISEIALVQPSAPAALPTVATHTTADFVYADAAALAKLNDTYQFIILTAANKTEADAAFKALTYDSPFDMWKAPAPFGGNETVYVAIRTKADANNFASKPTLVAINQIPAAPEVDIAYDYKAETIKFSSGTILAPIAIEANTKKDFTGDTIKSGDSIANLHSKKIYFRTPETATAAPSEAHEVEVPDFSDEKVPAVPVLSKTAESITIDNFGSYAKTVEFSIDGINWASKATFTANDDKVADGIEYTVYARYAGDNVNRKMPSKVSSAKVTTDKKKVVTFKNGATVVATSKFISGAALVYPAAPKKTGYKFAGWDVAAGTAVTADMTVNAQWKVIRGLKTIRKSAGRMTPAFKISQKTYKVVLSKSTSSVKLVAKRRSTAQVVKTYYKGKVYKTYYKTVKLSRGASTTVKFYVKAADGKTTTYYVKVVRK